MSSNPSRHHQGRRAIAAAMSEDDLKAAVLDAAHLYGWRVHHCRPAPAGKGSRSAAANRYATPIEGDAGFVDLVLAHPRYGVLFRELKSERGVVGEDQRDWLAVLATSGAVDVGVWRPADWVEGRIDFELRGRPE